MMKRRTFVKTATLGVGTLGLLKGSSSFAAPFAAAGERYPDSVNRLSSDDFKNYAVSKKYDVAFLSQLGLNPAKMKYKFVILADPQGGLPGHPSDEPKRLPKTMVTLNKVIQSINEQKDIDFCIIAGDIVDFEGEQEHYEEMEKYLKRLNMPVFYEAGNHETRYVSSGCVFRTDRPQENFKFLSNFIYYQKEMSGINRLCYSFDMGRVHYLIIPNLIREGFWETYPQILEWIDADLKAHQNMPVMVFHHSPVVPVGMEPIPGYSEDPSIKRKHMELFSKYNNVKYSISGHVHIPFKGSVKTAREYKGVKYLNFPTAGIYNRQIGESDFAGVGQSNGYAIVDVDEEKIDVTLKYFGGAEFGFGDVKPFNPDDYKLWFYEDWELPPVKNLLNGDFSKGLNHWEKYYLYEQDETSYLTQKIIQDSQKGNVLRLFVAGDTPTTGTVCTFNQLSQMIEWQGDKNPELTFDWLIQKADCGTGIKAGALVRIEGYQENKAVMKMAYWFGGKFGKPEHHYGRKYLYHHFDNKLTSYDQWNSAVIQPAQDVLRINQIRPNAKIDFTKIEKLKVTLQVWSMSRDKKNSFGIHYANVQLNAAPPAKSSIGGTEPDYIGTEVPQAG